MTADEFKSIIKPIQARLYNVALCITGNHDDAMDSVQETLIRLWRNSMLLASSDNREAYCTAALRNQCIDLIRRRHVTDSVDSIPAQPADDDDLTSRVEMRDELSMVGRAIAGLPDTQRTVIRLSVYGQCSNAEIAAITGLSDQNVRASLSRARRRLRELFTDKS